MIEWMGVIPAHLEAEQVFRHGSEVHVPLLGDGGSHATLRGQVVS